MNISMGVSKNKGKTPKMDVFFSWETLLKLGLFGGKPTIFGNTHIGGKHKMQKSSLSVLENEEVSVHQV